VLLGSRAAMARIGPAVVCLTATAMLAGCGGGKADTPVEARPTPAESTASPSLDETVAVSETPTTPSVTPGQTDAAGLVVPARTAGTLDENSVPDAADLGRGWERFVDPGDVAEGYTGNGDWVRERGAAEVVQAVVPLGCVAMSTVPSLPVPKHALEGTYRGPHDGPGVALVLDFASDNKASAFLAGMTQIARDCPAPAAKVGRDDPLTVVIEPVRLGSRTVLDRRREFGAGASEWLWSEMVVQYGSRVGLLILATVPSAAKPDLNRLSELLRTSVSR
jgi:hypothetical protein